MLFLLSLVLNRGLFYNVTAEFVFPLLASIIFELRLIELYAFFRLLITWVIFPL